MNKLTKKQGDFFKVLETFIENNHQAPTIVELQDELKKQGFSVESKRTVTQYLEALEDKGLIQRSGERRGIFLLDSADEVMLNVPILGLANAGSASAFAEEHFIGSLRISKKLLSKKKNIFALEVKGNSLNRSKIGGKAVEDGDWVIIDKDYPQPKNGDYVLSIISGSANLKKFYFDKKNNQIILFSESSEIHPPIFIHPDDVYMINGKIIQVIKKPTV